MKISPKFKAGCGVLTVFGLGFFLGALALLFFFVKLVPLAEGWKSEESKAFIAERFANQLGLDEAQRAQFEPIVREALERRWALRREYLLRDMAMVEDEFLPRVDPILDETQREKARKMLERWRRDHRFKVKEPEEKAPPMAPEGPEETGDGAS